MPGAKIWKSNLEMAISNETSGRVLYSLREEFVGRVIPSHMVDCLSDVLNQREEVSLGLLYIFYSLCMDIQNSILRYP